MFVAGLIRNDGQAIVHIANTTTHKITDVPAHDSEIGTNIGEPQEGWFERVKSVAGDLLIIEAAYIGRRYTCFIDLENHRFLREEGYVEGPLDGKLHHFLRSALGMLVSIFLPRKMIHEGGKPLAHSLRQSFHLTIRGAELIVVEPTSNIEV